jgi:hypothetical protein
MTDVRNSAPTEAGFAHALQITVTDEYHGTVDQATIDQWELRQARIALSLLKDALRGEQMLELLAPYIQAADERTRQIAAASNGEWGPPVESVIEVRGLRFDEFFTWFETHLADEPAMETANPDHYEIRVPDNFVTETMGGIPTRFRFDPEPVDPPKTFRPDPAFPIQPRGDVAVVTRLVDGSAAGGLGPRPHRRATPAGVPV